MLNICFTKPTWTTFWLPFLKFIFKNLQRWGNDDLLSLGISGITIRGSWNGFVRIFLNNNWSFIFQSLPETNSWSCSHKASHQSKDKLPTNIKRIGFSKRLLMLDRMKYHGVAGDGIHQEKKWIMVRRWVSNLQEYFEIF